MTWHESDIQTQIVTHNLSHHYVAIIWLNPKNKNPFCINFLFLKVDTKCHFSCSNWPIVNLSTQNSTWLGDSSTTNGNMYCVYIYYLNYGVAIAIRRNFLWILRPVDSFMSKSSPIAPSDNVHSKLCTSQNKLNSGYDKEILGQPLLLAPNGINWKSCPLKSIEEVKNFSGLNSFGLSHNIGSLLIAHALIITCVVCQLKYHSHVFSHLELIFKELTAE